MPIIRRMAMMIAIVLMKVFMTLFLRFFHSMRDDDSIPILREKEKQSCRDSKSEPIG